MLRRLVTPLLVCLVLAVALLVPLRAHAAILPACENRELLSLAPPPAPSILLVDQPGEPAPVAACEAPSGEPEGDSKVAPMCDPRGASIIAPPRIHPVNDDRIEASPSCELELTIARIGPGPRDSSSILFGAALAAYATLGDSALVPPACSELAPDYPPAEGKARSGVARDVYHPPR
jgi:hypothetical protein